METINERLLKVMNHYNFNRNSMARALGVNLMTMSYILTGRTKTVNSDILASIVKNLPDVNIEWVITGQEEMLKNHVEIKNVIKDKALNEIMNDKINQKFNLLHGLIEKEKKLIRNTLSRHGIVMDE